MGVQLNIKGQEARELAERLAEATGQSLTAAVTEALRARLAEVERSDRIATVLAMTEGNRERWPEHLLEIEHGDLLYDERGLPK